METTSDNEQQQQAPSSGDSTFYMDEMREDFVAPGVPIVRGSTPRPQSIALFPAGSESVNGQPTSAFPVEAPVAPPLPEEYEQEEQAEKVLGEAQVAVLAPGQSASDGEKSSEFIWLFEYDLAMDPVYLNSPERLRASAHRYGPAVLKGYQLQTLALPDGRTTATLTRCAAEECVVWGVLYRVPRRFLEADGDRPAALDNVHGAPYFKPLAVSVQETYRQRAIDCITYVIARGAQAPSAGNGFSLDQAYAERLLKVASQQQLPVSYLATLARDARPLAPETASVARREQDTEPLAALSEHAREREARAEQSERLELLALRTAHARRWFLALALYLVLLLFAALALIVAQSLGVWGLAGLTGLTLLGVPWYVPLYGLLGGCISCIVSLGRRAAPSLPGFVILTWFARPLLGAILGALAFFALNSGLFLLSRVDSERVALFSLLGTAAGLCEGWLFFRNR